MSEISIHSSLSSLRISRYVRSKGRAVENVSFAKIGSGKAVHFLFGRESYCLYACTMKSCVCKAKNILVKPVYIVREHTISNSVLSIPVYTFFSAFERRIGRVCMTLHSTHLP
jgi:hypothetical protein